MRTLPDQSDFRRSGREAELRVEGLPTGRGYRTRFDLERSNLCDPVGQQRKLSTASSPSSYKVWTAEEEEEEVDRQGYVLPGSLSNSDRGK